MAIQPWRTGEVIKIEQETPITRRFWIRIAELEKFDFIPGQFVTLDLPIHEKVNKRWRSYSIASWPDGSNVFELVIVLDKEGIGTNYLFNQVTVGTNLTLRGPQGVFAIKEPISKDIVMICTGTGIAPFRSMLQHIYQQKIAHQTIYLVFGCRTKDDLLYHTELKALQNNMAGFQYLPTLSREEWEGNTGYVHGVYERICEDKRPIDFYLCGWKGMIDDAKQRIIAMDYHKTSIHQEIYG